MYCKNCGSLLDSDESSKFCSSCGFALSASSGETSKFVNKSTNYNSPSVATNKYHLSQLKGNLQIIGIFELIIGAFLLLGSLLMIGVRYFVINNVQNIDPSSIQDFNIGMQVLLAMGLFLLVVALFIFVSGIGLLQSKKWSRVTSMIVGALAIFSFPVGTIFGAFTLYYLSRPETSSVLVN